MKLTHQLVIAVLIVSMSIAYSDGLTDNHKVTIIIPEIALLDIEPQASKDITVTMTAPTEAGNPLASSTDKNLWLNVTSIVATGKTRNISVKINAPLAGLNLKVASAAYAGSGFGSWGTPQPQLTLTASDQTLVSGLKSGFTANGANNGYNLTYTAEPVASNDFGDIVSSAGSEITVTYTLTE